MPPRAKLYSATVALGGIPLFALSLAAVIQDFNWTWLTLIVLCLVASLFPVTLPSKPGVAESLTLTLSDVFIFSALLLLGPASAVTVAVLDGFASSLRMKSKPLYKQLFNMGALSLVTMLSGQLFYWMVATEPPLDPNRLPGLLVFSLSLAVSACVFYLLNTGAVGLAIALSTRQSLSEVWKTRVLWSALATVAGASVAALVFLTVGQAQLYGVVFGIPIVLVIYNAYRMNLERITEAERHASEVSSLYTSTIASLATAIDAKDQCTHGHLHRVQVLAVGLARLSGYDDPLELEGLKAAALLHDIGKLAVPESILNKPTGLTQWETLKMRTHPNVGADILSSVPFPYPVTSLVRCHHERWDGNGYPQGLRGTEIPRGARILAIADCYDALRSDRPYRPRLSIEATVDYIQSEAGKAYDPFLVEVLAENTQELERQMEDAEKQLPRGVLNSMEGSLAPSPEKPRLNVSATLFHQTASQQKEIQRVQEMSQAFGRCLDLDETLSILGAKIRSLVACEALAIYLLDAERGKLVPYHADGAHAEALLQTELAWGEGITGWVTANRQPLVNVSPWPDFPRQHFLSASFSGCLSVPMCDEESVLGGVTLYSARQAAYGEEDLRLMQTIAHYSVSIITNALIFEDRQPEAFIDRLTGLPNVRHFRAFAEKELKRADLGGYAVSLAAIRLDDLEGIRQRLGPKAAELALAEMAHLLRSQIRKTDICVRNGDRFLVMLPGLDRPTALPTLSRIQQAVQEHSVRLDAAQSYQMEASFSLAVAPQEGVELNSLLDAADRGLRRDRERRGRLRESPSVLPFDKRELGR